MQYTARAYNGMVVSPHRLASEAGIAVLRKGGNAIEATVATAAALCVVYPHMTGLGGDAVWLVMPGKALAGEAPEPLVIDACGRSALAAGLDWYLSRGMASLPVRGPGSALTMAGAVSGWRAALNIAEEWNERGGRPSLGLGELFEDALHLAENGFPVTAMQSTVSFSLLGELAELPGFSRTFLLHDRAPGRGQRLVQPVLARTLRRLADDGLDAFYQGDLAREMAADLEKAGSPCAWRTSAPIRRSCAVPFPSPPSRPGCSTARPPPRG